MNLVEISVDYNAVIELENVEVGDVFYMSSGCCICIAIEVGKKEAKFVEIPEEPKEILDRSRGSWFTTFSLEKKDFRKYPITRARIDEIHYTLNPR